MCKRKGGCSAGGGWHRGGRRGRALSLRPVPEAVLEEELRHALHRRAHLRVLLQLVPGGCRVRVRATEAQARHLCTSAELTCEAKKPCLVPTTHSQWARPGYVVVMRESHICILGRLPTARSHASPLSRHSLRPGGTQGAPQGRESPHRRGRRLTTAGGHTPCAASQGPSRPRAPSCPPHPLPARPRSAPGPRAACRQAQPGRAARAQAAARASWLAPAKGKGMST